MLKFSACSCAKIKNLNLDLGGVQSKQRGFYLLNGEVNWLWEGILFEGNTLISIGLACQEKQHISHLVCPIACSLICVKQPITQPKSKTLLPARCWGFDTYHSWQFNLWNQQWDFKVGIWASAAHWLFSVVLFICMNKDAYMICNDPLIYKGSKFITLY